MTELSPATQAVLDAALPTYDDEHLYVATMEKHAGMIAAAALRAAADLVAPDDYKCYTRNLEWDAGMEARTDAIREELLAIADELEAQ